MYDNDKKNKEIGSYEAECDTITLTPDISRSPPLFSIGDNAFDALNYFTSLAGIKEQEAELITAIFDLCAVDPDHVTDIQQVALRLGEMSNRGKGVGISAIRKRLKRLVDAGIFTVQKISLGRQGRGMLPNIYVLAPCHMNALELPSDCDPVLPQMELFTDAQSLEFFDSSQTKMDHFFCQLLVNTLPIDDNSNLTYLETEFFHSSTAIPLKIRARVGRRIPTIRSIKTVIAVLTIIEQIIHDRIEYGRTVGTQFVINLGQVLELMALDNKGGNRRTILNYILSWEATSFELQKLPAEIQTELEDKFGNKIFGFSNHQIWSNVKGVGALKSGQKIPTHIAIQLDENLVTRIRTGNIFNLFSVTPAIMKEENTMAIAFHLYARKTLGHRQTPFQIQLKTLWKRIAKSMTFRAFKKSFLKMLGEKIALQMENPEFRETFQELDTESKAYHLQTNILGYNTTLIGEKVIFRVDLEDRYVGLYSKHAQLTEKSQRLASSTAEREYRIENPDAYKDKK